MNFQKGFRYFILSCIALVWVWAFLWSSPSFAAEPCPILTIPSDQEQITTLFEQVYPTSIREQDEDTYRSLYTEDALWSPPSLATRYGPDDIIVGFHELLAGKFIDPTSTATEIEVKDDFAYVIGWFNAHICWQDPTIPAETKRYQAMWLLQKENGEWKIARQIWNVKPLT